MRKESIQYGNRVVRLGFGSKTLYCLCLHDPSWPPPQQTTLTWVTTDATTATTGVFPIHAYLLSWIVIPT